jgi:hypothetical protein
LLFIFLSTDNLSGVERSMSLQDSPGFDQTSFDESEGQLQPQSYRHRLWWVIGGLALVLLALAVVNYAGAGAVERVSSKGAVTGIVVSEEGNGVLAEVFIAGTNLETFTDETGNFSLESIPEGQRILVVGYEQTGWEFPVTIVAGQTIDLGEISVIATATP